MPHKLTIIKYSFSESWKLHPYAIITYFFENIIWAPNAILSPTQKPNNQNWPEKHLQHLQVVCRDFTFDSRKITLYIVKPNTLSPSLWLHVLGHFRLQHPDLKNREETNYMKPCGRPCWSLVLLVWDNILQHIMNTNALIFPTA